MGEGVHTLVERNEEACFAPSREQLGAEPEIHHELTMSYDSMLSLCQFPDRRRRLAIPHRSTPSSRTAST